MPVAEKSEPARTTVICASGEEGGALHCASGAQDLSLLGDRDGKRKAPPDASQSEAASTPTM